MAKINDNTLGKFYIIATTLFWGSTFVVIKLIMDKITPLFLIAVRFSIAALLLGIVFNKNVKRIDSRTLRSGIIIGIFLFGGYAIQTLGIHEGEPGRIAFLSSLYCVLVPFMMWAVKGNKPTRNNIIAAFLCLSGIGVVSYTGNGAQLGLGDVLAILSGFIFAGHITSLAILVEGKDPIAITIIQMTVTAILAWIFCFLKEDLSTLVFDTGSITGILYLTIICTCLAITFQTLGQQKTNPNTAALIFSTEAVFSIILSVIFYNEPVTTHSIIGFAIIFSGLVVSEWKRPDRKPSETKS